MGYTPHVLVVGGGPLGAGLARDFAIRGLEVTLVDPGPLASPRVGRMDGLLASGAQFAREDPAYAKRCLAENRTLFEIASHCVEDTGGLVLGDDLDGLQAACEECSIAARQLSGAEAREREPGLASTVDGALAVPDAAIDPSLLTVATARDASEYGADIRPRTEVTDISVEDGAVDSAVVRYDPLPDVPEDGETAEEEPERGGETGEDEPEEDEPVRSDGGKSVPGTLDVDVERPGEGGEQLEPNIDRLDVDYIVNVAGTGAPDVAELADCSVPVSQRQATMVVGDGRPVETAVTRPAGATPDSVVPVGQRTLLAAGSPGGATEGDGDQSAADMLSGVGGRAVPSPSAVDAVEESLSELATTGQTLRAFRMPRYEVTPGEGRDFAVLDHDGQGCWGLLTVLGGTVTTHRWAAERVCDRVCREFGIRRACQTDDMLLPGSEDVPDLAQAVGTFGLAESVYEQSKRRLGSETHAVLHTDDENPVLCPCQSVTRAEVGAALDDGTSAEADLGGVRVRTSATTGACQGGRCAHRLAAELHPGYALDVVEEQCGALLAERWQGQRPVAGRLSTMARSYQRHAATMNRGHEHDLGHEDIAGFDDGFDESAGRPTCCPRVGWEP
jgi:glycerol-3-phosphate dehydrogenase